VIRPAGSATRKLPAQDPPAQVEHHAVVQHAHRRQVDPVPVVEGNRRSSQFGKLTALSVSTVWPPTSSRSPVVAPRRVGAQVVHPVGD
jgi:hypothetical protein